MVPFGWQPVKVFAVVSMIEFLVSRICCTNHRNLFVCRHNRNAATYNSFIKDVARKLDKITIDKNTYTCETCKINYKHN